MKVVALHDNETLKIKSGKVYNAFTIYGTNLIEVENDFGDNVIMSRFSFIKFEENK
jgi:hypothetical protein